MPPEIGDLVWLLELEVDDNKLTNLPVEFNNLINLNELLIRGNYHPTAVTSALMLQFPFADVLPQNTPVANLRLESYQNIQKLRSWDLLGRIAR